VGKKRKERRMKYVRLKKCLVRIGYFHINETCASNEDVCGKRVYPKLYLKVRNDEKFFEKKNIKILNPGLLDGDVEPEQVKVA
jgi:hypothetical protein